MGNGFDYWKNGAVRVTTNYPGDFSIWHNGAVLIDHATTTTAAFGGIGFGVGLGKLSSTVGLPGTGTGVGIGNATLASTIAIPGSGTGVALGNAVLASKVGLKGSGIGFAFGFGTLSSTGPVVVSASRILSPRQPRLHRLDFTAHPFAYRRIASHEAIVRHLGD